MLTLDVGVPLCMPFEASLELGLAERVFDE